MSPKSVDKTLIHFSDKSDQKEMADDVKNLAKLLTIPNTIARKISSELEKTFKTAEQAVTMVGGSPDDISKLWGYNFAKFMFNYLNSRETVEGRQALSFIKMQLGHEINLRLEGSEMQYSSFVLGLSLRFMKGFDKLKDNLIELEGALQKFEEHKYLKKKEEEESKIDLFGRSRND